MKPETLDTLYGLVKPAIFKLNLDPEFMHRKAIGQIKKLDDGDEPPQKSDFLDIDVFGHHFDSPLLVAAGFDKYVEVADKVQSLGFAGGVEGSFTAERSDGNKGKRLVRIVKDRAIWNRMGLNNPGAEAAGERLEALGKDVCYAVSIAKSNNPKIKGDEAIRDYLTSYNLLKNLGVFTEINISCPNTEDGRTFAYDPNALEVLLKEINSSGKGKPLVIKLPPYLRITEIQAIVEVSKGLVDGYAAVNTQPYTYKGLGNGGRSGLPLQDEAARTITLLRMLTDKPIIGMGGIFTGKDAFRLLYAGANLLEGFTGFIYRGPLYALKVNRELGELESRKI